MDKEKLKARLEEIKRRQSQGSTISYPSTPEMIRSAAKSLLNNIKSVAAGNPLKVDPNLATQRLNICRNCPFFDSVAERCSKCGCFLSAKTYLRAEKCPLGKW